MNADFMPDDLKHRITAMLNNELSPTERDETQRALADHGVAQRQHAIEGALVQMLHGRREQLRERVPVDVERRIRVALANEREAQFQPTQSLWNRVASALLRPAIAVPVLGGIAAFMVTTTILNRPDAGNGQSVTVPNQQVSLVDLRTASYDNFASIVRGELKLVHPSSDPRELQSWFASQGVQYSAVFPTIAAKLEGGVVSDHNGKKFAHLVYSVNDHLVYMFEVDEASVADKSVTIDKSVNDNLTHGKWHWEEKTGTGTLFMWKSNNVVCSAVSDLRTDELSALFALNEL